jgi:GT2 family glycosyltransferase
MSVTPDLSVCVVNHRTPELTRACLYSVIAAADTLALDLRVLNNTADALELSGVAHPITLIQNERPAGFGANQNRLARNATGRYLLLLNSDTLVPIGALTAMVRFMDTHPRCGIAGPRMVFVDGSLQASMRSRPTVINAFVEASGAFAVLRRWPVFGRVWPYCADHSTERAVDWLSGACLIVRPDAVRTVGLFDDAQLPGMYFEDTDLCLRMWRAGWEVRYTPTATITHLESKSPLGASIVESGRVNFDAFYRKHSSPIVRRAIMLAMALGFTLRLAFAGNRPGSGFIREYRRFVLTRVVRGFGHGA